MKKKDKIHDEVQKLFRGFEAKPIERNSKKIYGIAGDIHKVGTEKSEQVWYTKMEKALNTMKKDEAKIYKGPTQAIFSRKISQNNWAAGFVEEDLQLKAESEVFIVSTSDLLTVLYRMKDL